MALEQRLEALATAVGTDVRDLRGRTGNLAALSTSARGSLVAAINELVTAIGAIEGGGTALINDSATATGTTWSSSKIAAEVADAISELVGSAPEALDTLQEIADELENQDSAVAALVAALATRVRFDEAQALTSGQQAQACANIGVGDPDVDLVGIYESARSS